MVLEPQFSLPNTEQTNGRWHSLLLRLPVRHPRMNIIILPAPRCQPTCPYGKSPFLEKKGDPVISWVWLMEQNWMLPSLSTNVVVVSCQAVYDSSRPHELQHARLPCPSPSPRVCLSSCLMNWWCHLTISFPVTLFFFLYPQHQGLFLVN